MDIWQVMAEFTSETKKARGNNIFKVLKGKCRSKILYSVKILFKNIKVK